MSKLTPLILAIIMLASTSFAALDLSELEQNNMIEADGRVGPDADVVSILSPRDTTTDEITGEKLHTLKAGEDVNFEAFISNAGDSAIIEMGISVTVYLAESGARGMIAKDAAGNDLSWINNDVICDDSFVCPWSSLASGDNLANGKYTMSYQGSPATWTPSTGDYVVVVEASADGDNDPGNDYHEAFVSVVDWSDIIVDLAWDSGKEVEGGSGDKAFTLTVSTGGSAAWSARSIMVEMIVAGTLENEGTIGQDGAFLMGTTEVSGFGTSTPDTEIFRHQEDENNVTNATRVLLAFDDEASWSGQVSPDMSGGSGDYSVEVNLKSYVMYGQLPDCAETVSTTNAAGEREDRSYIHYCEVTAQTDDDAGTSEAMIEGKVQTYHDIGVSSLVINQGYITDANGTAMTEPSMPGIFTGPLNPAWSSVQASVRHLGSDLMTTYDWEVTFEIQNTVTGEVLTEVADSCTFGFGQPYQHLMLGNDPMQPDTAFEVGEACIMFNFEPGIYNISATVSMINIEQVDDGTGTMVDKYTDMSARNDDSDIYKISALNNRPDVSLTLETAGELVVGEDGAFTLVANAVDADDESGNNLTYIWTHPGLGEGENGTAIASPCNGQGMLKATCELFALDYMWAGANTYSVSVSDAYGSSAYDFVNIDIWNRQIGIDSSDSGIEMLYDLTYRGTTIFDVEVSDSEGDGYTQDLSEFGFAGEYTSVAVLDYTPGAVYLAQDVHVQSMTINYDATSITPTSVFWINSNGKWVQLDSTISEFGSDSSIAINLDSIGQVLAQGEIALMGGELQIIEAPLTNPVMTDVVATKGGNIQASWTYSGNTVPGYDWLSMEICVVGGDCTTTVENTTLLSHSMSGQTDTTHGYTYTYKLQVCNAGGCNPTIATGMAQADSRVNGDARAESMSVANKDDSYWTVSWTVAGAATEEIGWMVCYADYSWTSSGEMPTSNEMCADAEDATTVDIKQAGGQGTKTYYFTAVPYDLKGNMDNALPGTDIVLVIDSTIEDDCEVNPSADGCTVGDATEGGTVPTWTWGVIIGLVVVAFVVGAFILSRGGDGEDGKDWDY